MSVLGKKEEMSQVISGIIPKCWSKQKTYENLDEESDRKKWHWAWFQKVNKFGLRRIKERGAACVIEMWWGENKGMSRESK